MRLVSLSFPKNQLNPAEDS